ncbi:hypothetical protein EBT25_09205 [bacterium]|jgi:hypothetical protein|nr:hypothetical protein [bacterium]
MTETKVCSFCKKEKSLSSFYKRSDYGGYRSDCKECIRIKQAKRWSSNPEFKKRGIARQRRWQRQKFYGLSLEQELNFLALQNSCCAICNKHFETDADYHVDHCHDTNKIRGLLCPGCNKGLGLFNDNPEALRQAAIYVESQGVSFFNEPKTR